MELKWHSKCAAVLAVMLMLPALLAAQSQPAATQAQPSASKQPASAQNTPEPSQQPAAAQTPAQAAEPASQTVSGAAAQPSSPQPAAPQSSASAPQPAGQQPPAPLPDVAHTQAAVAPPLYSFARSIGGAILVVFTPPEPGITVHYTLDGSTPTINSPVYNTPILVYSSITIKAVSIDERLPDHPSSAVTTHIPVVHVPDGALAWSEEFNNDSQDLHPANPSVWTYDTGNSGFGNHELETYCALGDNKPPCDPDYANAYVGTDEALHIVARTPSYQVYTSARLNTKGLFSFQYGRVEVRAKVPEAQGFWPAFWLLGTNIDRVQWPACGEMDVLERTNAAKDPDWNEGSIHGPGFTGNTGLGTVYNFPKGTTAADWHKYGMIWKPGSIAFYVDDPKHPYVTYTPESLKSLSGASWPFDNGQTFFLIVNLAIGGDWPGPPDATTTFPQEMLVDYIRVFKNN